MPFLAAAPAIGSAIGTGATAGIAAGAAPAVGAGLGSSLLAGAQGAGALAGGIGALGQKSPGSVSMSAPPQASPIPFAQLPQISAPSDNGSLMELLKAFGSK